MRVTGKPGTVPDVACSIMSVCAQKCANWTKGSGRKSFSGNDSTFSAVSDGACAAARFARCAATKMRIGQTLRLLEIAIGKIRLKITMAVHIPNATKLECGKV